MILVSEDHFTLDKVLRIFVILLHILITSEPTVQS